MKIAHFALSFSELTETFVYDLALEMGRQGAESAVITRARVNAESRPFDAVELLGPRSWPDSLKAFLSPKLGIKSDPFGLARALRSIRPDVVWAHFGPAGYHAAGACRALGIPLIVNFYSHEIYAAERPWLARYRELFSCATRVVAPSEHVRKALVRVGAAAERTEVLYLGVRPEEFDAQPPSRRFDGKLVQILHVGRLVEKKDPVGLIEAFGLARARTPADRVLHLTIAGDGPLRGPAVRRAAELGLANCVKVLGPVPRERVRELMAAAHIYAQFARTGRDGDQEGLGVSFLEAAASGLPVVSTRHGGICEAVVHESTGLLTPESDMYAFAGSISRLAANPSLRASFGAAGRARVEREFSLPAQARKAVALAVLDSGRA